MKYSKKDYLVLRDTIAAFVDNYREEIKQYFGSLEDNPKIQDPARALRWKIAHASKALHKVAENYSSYYDMPYNDDHHDTALRAVMLELNL